MVKFPLESPWLWKLCGRGLVADWGALGKEKQLSHQPGERMALWIRLWEWREVKFTGEETDETRRAEN